MKLRKAVLNGVRWLDRNGPPDWWDRIDTDRLRMQSASRCVLGQLYGGPGVGLFGYTRVIAYTRHELPSIPHTTEGMAPRYGFTTYAASPTVSDKSFADLTEQWRYVIQIRRAFSPALTDTEPTSDPDLTRAQLRILTDAQS